MQALHAGRYGFHPFVVAPSGIKSPISPFKPWVMSQYRIKKPSNILPAVRVLLNWLVMMALRLWAVKDI